LPAIAVRWDHQSSRHLRRPRGAEALAQQLQAGVQTGRGARRGHDVVLLEVEHIRLHVDVGEARGHRGGEFPVGGRATSAQQPGFGEHEGTEAESDHAGAGGVGLAQRAEQPLRWPFGDVAPARHHHDGGVAQGRQRCQSADPVTGGRAQRLRLRGAKQQLGGIGGRERLAEDHARNREVEGADAIEGDDRYADSAVRALVRAHRRHPRALA
jgi:hypothetical protein